ncbi:MULTISPECIES: MFS transporter [unclassified Nocardiopsis]|uniref:MFS transporter n=1 Tax=unclassified Nocardiopsis TaxID=2649073 RepID=UPI001358291F|nr:MULTISPECIES: MFS transporter [unclassified Nocardiopsis]
MSSPTTGGPARVLGAARAHRGLLALSVTVTTSYGVLFYAFPVLAPAITADTGWSLAALTACFSAAQVVAGLTGIAVGRWLHRRGPRPAMTAAAVLAVPALAAVASARDLWLFGAAWLVAGTAMAGLFYPPAFAALTRWYDAGRVRALTVLTLVAGLASTVFAPLTAVLEASLGWRGAYLALGGVLVAVVVPLHAFALPRAWDGTATARGPGGTGHVRAVVGSAAFWALAAALTAGSLTVYAVVINLVPLLQERGFDTTTAAWALGAGGVGQVLGRLVYGPLERRTAPVPRALAVLGACSVTTLLLALVPGPLGLVMAVAVLAGTARGVLTLLQATAVVDWWGTRDHATLNGLLHVPVMVAVALAPWAGAALAGPVGGYPAAFTLLGVLAGVGALAVLASRPSPVPAPAPS